MDYQTEPYLAQSGWCGKSRAILLIPQARYRVEPQNPRKKKNRGRTCTFVKIRRFGGGTEMAAVVWDDTGEYGGVDLSDLVVVE